MQNLPLFRRAPIANTASGMNLLPPTSAVSFKGLKFWLGMYRRRQQFRRLFVPLLEMDALMLGDIGFQKTDIRWALELPLDVDAMAALSACRQTSKAA